MLEKILNADEAARMEDALAKTAVPVEPDFVDFVFTEQRDNLIFAEVEDPSGRGVNIGEWLPDDGSGVRRLRVRGVRGTKR